MLWSISSQTRGSLQEYHSIRKYAARLKPLGVFALVMASFLTASIPAGARPFSISGPKCPATKLKLVNHNPFNIWIGEKVASGFKILPPPNHDWEMAPGASIDMCVPPNWTSGIFWARTECDFTDLYQSNGNSVTRPFTACRNNTGCNSLAKATGLIYDCVAGACMVDCTSNQTNSYCNGVIGPQSPPNTQAICSNANSGSKYVCTYPSGVVCRTGDCDGLYQCEDTSAGNNVNVSPESPSSLFEITDTASADGGKGAANYDVSNVSGYNNPIQVSLDFTPSGSGNSTCTAVGCASDLNASCPTLLQVIEPPTTTVSSIPCGSDYCQAGQCVTCPTDADPSSCAGGLTCDIGCNGPGSLCGSAYPTPVSAPGVPGLDCDDTIPTPTPVASWTPDNSEYRDMYQAENASGNQTSSNINTAMFSGNQGTPTCWGDLDCAPGETCLLGAASGITGLAPDVGICATKNGGGTPIALQVTDCNSASDEGKHCGGYPNSPVYTCVAASGVSDGVACLPAFNPAIAGLGTYDSSSGLFTGIAAPLNPEWNAAALWASGTGSAAGTTPYYETFSNACSHQYAWTYDDHTGGLACNGYPLAFTVAFGSLSATPTPTATTTATPTPTPSATATPSPTPSPSPTTTPSSSPTPTATPSASPTASPSPTTTASPSPTPTTTPSATPSTTPSSTPSATPTPICTPGVFLSTSPAGTLAFGDVAAGTSVTLPLTVTNTEPAGTLRLSAAIHGEKEGFKVTGGTCRSHNSLDSGASCIYEVRLTGKPQNQGAVSTELVITGHFEHHACPGGDVQTTTVTLAGNVAAAARSQP